MTQWGWLRRTSIAAPLVVLALWLGAPAASAHSYFLDSDPPDGAILAKAPARVVLVFSSAVTADFTSADLVEARGQHYQPAAVVADRSTPNVVTLALPKVPTGSYRLTFVTRDRVDLHQTAGSIVFGVGTAPGGVTAAPQPAPARPSEFVLRWVGLAGLAALLGGLLIALLVAPRLGEGPDRARAQAAVLSMALGGALAHLASGAALLALQVAGLGPDLRRTVPRLLTGSEYGSRWLASSMLGVALVLFVALLRRQAARGGVASLGAEFGRLGPWALLTAQVRTLLLAVALAAATAVSGHAAGAAGLTAGEVLLRTLHLVAMGLWAGGLLGLVVGLLVLRRSGVQRAGGVRTLVLGFGRYAGIGFALLGVTGLLLSGSQVASVTALLSTSYGLVLALKVGATGLVAAVALRHAVFTWRALGSKGRHLRPPRALLATAGLECGGALVVMLLAAVLGSSAPARGSQFDPISSEVPATQVTRQSGELLGAVSVKPNRLGPNLLSVQVVDSRRPPLAPISGVSILLRQPGASGRSETLTTTRTGSRFDAGTVNLTAGDLDVAVLVHRSGLTDRVIQVPWRVNGPEVVRAPVVISAAPFAPLVNLVAALLAVTGAAVLLAGVLRSRRGRDEESGPVRTRTPAPHGGRIMHTVRGWRRPDGETSWRAGHPPRRGQDQRSQPAGDTSQRRP
ncbi:copper resistance protein CopC [Candidatus Nephthysia bennettiae]|uniref:Copper resistance protein CopC n=1 Tax=Candidatus Nephthysia bennettiae TaxID=3127016 RepID=A0A934K2B5_9BACT|nr:copper resistance protein CopC [Candidatus Dormibacteraeota bacterium]MBJ7612049.1 copper resistance protein CopC [Candidatus Dormibacteraeota bacterium]